VFFCVLSSGGVYLNEIKVERGLKIKKCKTFMKSKISVILVILVIVILGAGVYLFMSLQTANEKIQTLENEKAALQAKIDKGLAYAEVFDVLMWSGWKASGLTLRFQFDNDVDALVDLESRIKSLNDTELEKYQKEIKKMGDDTSVVKAMDYLLGAIEKSLK